MSFRDSAVLVTGGVGLIGSHLVEALVAQGARVTVVQRDSINYSGQLPPAFDQVEMMRLDLRELTIETFIAAQRFDCVFHLAGSANSPFSVSEPRLDFENNVIVTFNLLEALRNHFPSTTFINVSSAAVYGEGSANPLSEKAQTEPLTPYGVSKLTAERYSTLYARLYGLRTVNLRLFPVYGPRIRRWVVYDLIRKGWCDPVTLPVEGDGNQLRDFNHIADVIRAMMLVADRAPLLGETYNVAAGRSVTILELAVLICNAMNINPRFDFSGSVAPGKSGMWCADVSALTALGYQPKVDLREGIAGTVAWFTQEFDGQRRGEAVAGQIAPPEQAL